MRTWNITMTIVLAKMAWSSAIVLWLAASEPFWHQVVLVLGGAAITAFGTLAAAWMVSRRVTRPIEHVSSELEAHRQAIEDNGEDH